MRAKNLGISPLINARSAVSGDMVAMTVTTAHGGIAQFKVILGDEQRERRAIDMDDEEIQQKIQTGELTVRYLTAKECWRLMDLCPMDRATGGFDDTPYERAAEVCSRSQLYKQAGNSIVVGCLEAIFEAMLIPEEERVRPDSSAKPI